MYGLPIPNPPYAEEYVEEGDVVKFGNTQLKVIFTPGHTAGHITFLIDSIKSAIVGDVLFHQSIGRTDLPGGDYNQLIDTIKRKLLVLEDDWKVYPGHMSSTTIGEERINNPFLR